MRGSIKERSPGSYSLIISYKDDAGKWRQKWRTVHCKNKTQADVELRKWLTEIDKGSVVSPGKETVSSYLKTWLADYIKPNLSRGTYDLYNSITNNHLLPAIGKIKLTDIKPQHLQKLYAEKQAAGLSNRTVQLIHVTIHKALKNAVKIGLVYRNIAEAVDTPKIAKYNRVKFMEEGAIETFLAEVSKTDYYTLFYCYFFTGCRRSELLKLQWQDVDLLLCQMSVRGTKTATSRRLIALSPNTVAVLTDHRQKQDEQRQKLGLPLLTNADLVFCHWDGTPLRPDSITHLWERIAGRCGLSGFRLHDARHTHASLLLKQGVHPKIVQERLGHAGIAITLDLYSHVVPGLQQAAANRLDELFTNKLISNPLAKPKIEKNSLHGNL